METGFLNLYDEEHFSTLPSPYYQRDGLDDNCVLELGDDFTYEVCNFEDSTNFWENQQELNCDLVDLPLTMSIDECFPKSDSSKHEDFQKMLLEWKEHFGSMQASDSEDEVGMTVVSDQLPDKIFEDETFEYKTKKNKDVSLVAPKLSTSYCWNVNDLKVEPLTEQNFSQNINEYQEAKSINIKEEPECVENKPVVNVVPEFKFEKNESVFKDEVIANLGHTILKVNDNDCTLDPVEGDLFTDLKIEIDEDCIDVETISDQIPVLEAGDLKSLLEQFEASEAFNSTSNSCSQVPPPSMKLPLISHQTIKDSLPKEVIERIKASARKKVIPLIPAMPTKRQGRVGTRMQDAAAALNRNKLLKIVSGGESIQLDHDYCSSMTSELPKPFYNSDASEYVTPLPDKQKSQSVDEGTTKDQLVSHPTEYYVVLASQGADAWDKNSRKDSGLESGDVSDASEETLGSLSVTSNDSVLNKLGARPVFRETVLTTPLRNVSVKVKEPTMVSVLKKCNVASVLVPNVDKVDVPSSEVSNQEKNPVQGPKKRKLNLEEYRNRLKDRAINLSNQNNLSEGKEVTDSLCVEGSQTQPSRPEMHSVEVQADIEKDTAEKDNRSGLNRDRRQRQYRSRRMSSSSSSGSSSSSSSSSSCSSTASASRHRRERARKRRTRKNRRNRSTSSSSCSSSSCSVSSDSSRRLKHSSRRKHKHKNSKRSKSRGHSASLSRSHSSSSNSSTNSSHSSNSSRSRSRSRSSGARSHSSSWKSESSQNYRKCNNYWEWQRSRSPPRGPRSVPALTEREKQRQVEERRVIYVGRIDEGTSKAELRRRFEAFGPIVDISVHFREHGDNYGFVTFAYKVDAYEAVEHGNDDPSLPRYDLCFGGRRAFCKTRYSDLDGMATNCDGNSNGYSRRPPNRSRNQNEDSFDLLLREAQAKMRKRKV